MVSESLLKKEASFYSFSKYYGTVPDKEVLKGEVHPR